MRQVKFSLVSDDIHPRVEFFKTNQTKDKLTITLSGILSPVSIHSSYQMVPAVTAMSPPSFLFNPSFPQSLMTDKPYHNEPGYETERFGGDVKR